jgi:hypothetical protein
MEVGRRVGHVRHAIHDDRGIPPLHAQSRRKDALPMTSGSRPDAFFAAWWVSR